MIQPALDTILEALEAAHPDHTVEGFPDDTDRYEFLDPVAAHLVIFMDTDINEAPRQRGKQNELLPIFDVVQLTHELPLAYQLLDTTYDALDGLVEDTFEFGHPYRVQRQSYAGQRSGPVWIYRTRIEPWND